MQTQTPGQMPYQQAQAMAYVGVGPRFLAILVDSIIIGIIVGIINAVGIGGSGVNAGHLAVSGGIDGILGIAYFIVLEATMGATLGKRLLGLRVVKEDGSPISWGGSIIRNLLRIIDSILFYLVGAIIIWNTSRRQRLGDILGHTVVVKARG